MSVNKNVSVCVATSPRLLIKVDATAPARTHRPLTPAAQTSYARRRRGIRTQHAEPRAATPPVQRATATTPPGKPDPGDAMPPGPMPGRQLVD